MFKTKHKHDNSLLLNKSNVNREALKPSHNFVYIPQKELTFSFSVFVTNETFQEVWHKQNRANFLNIREKSTFFDKNRRQTLSLIQIEKYLLLIIIYFYLTISRFWKIVIWLLQNVLFCMFSFVRFPALT